MNKSRMFFHLVKDMNQYEEKKRKMKKKSGNHYFWQYPLIKHDYYNTI